MSMQQKSVIEKVTSDRWVEAQRWEEAHWVNTQHARARFGKNWIWRVLFALGWVSKYRGDDWNQWWKAQFDDYKFLPAKVENAIEVGCGPYTNVCHMLGRCHFHHLVLSDPLIRTYAKFKLTFVSEMYREAACMLDDHPIESLPFRPDFFDVAVMINVLDHVEDARKCMENLVGVVKRGGIMILGQDLTNEADMEVLKGAVGEIGHPIKLNHEWFNPFLTGFEPIIQKLLTREQGRDAKHHYGTLIFVGRKR